MLAWDKSFPGDLHTERLLKLKVAHSQTGSPACVRTLEGRRAEALFQLCLWGGGPEQCGWGKGMGAPRLPLRQCSEPLQTPWLALTTRAF